MRTIGRVAWTILKHVETLLAYPSLKEVLVLHTLASQLHLVHLETLRVQ